MWFLLLWMPEILELFIPPLRISNFCSVSPISRLRGSEKSGKTNSFPKFDSVSIWKQRAEDQIILKSKNLLIVSLLEKDEPRKNLEAQWWSNSVGKTQFFFTTKEHNIMQIIFFFEIITLCKSYYASNVTFPRIMKAYFLSDNASKSTQS